jgi:uncharacterized protein YihD (DUF1040 family)
MRDPNRIPEVIEALQDFWEQNPDLRLAQIICLCNHGVDPFYLEDDNLLRNIRQLVIDL